MTAMGTYFATAQQRREDEKPKGSQILIERANAVSIFHVLIDFFGIDVPTEGLSFKSPCPFGDEHPDGGMDKGWRTYPDSNSSMCFVQHGYMPPVRLIQNKYGLKPQQAASKILAYYGLLSPKNYRDRWQDVLVWQERHGQQVGNLQHAVEALHMALRSESGYMARQFDSDVISALECELEKSSDVLTVSDLHRWYDQARHTLISVVGGTPK